MPPHVTTLLMTQKESIPMAFWPLSRRTLPFSLSLNLLIQTLSVCRCLTEQ